MLLTTLCGVLTGARFTLYANRKLEAERSDDPSEAVQRGIAVFGEHLINVLAIEVAGTCHGGDFARIEDIFERDEERGVRILERRLQIVRCINVVS